MNSQLETLIAEERQVWSNRLNDGRVHINVCLDTSSIASGAEATLAMLYRLVKEHSLPVELGITGSWGFCWLEPTLTVRSAAGTRTVLYANVTADRVEELLQACVVDGGELPELALGVVEGRATSEIPLLSDHPFMRGQERRLMADIGRIDPEDLGDYLATGGYEGFLKALEMDPEAIIKEVVDSGLGGRGGGGFPTGRKWDFLRTATADPKYLVCNADEGDPGAWVNRILMEGNPQLIVEGMLIAALATGASEGYIYIRYEYPLAIQRMQVAVQQAYEAGLLGKDILGTGHNVDLIVFKGAGSYVCGEETGLINSIDGFRGMPRIKPPFPAQAGLWNKPTNVNNVESYANAPLIMRQGAEWWGNVSSAKEKGTKMFTLSGQINWHGCFEIPFGPTIRELLDNWGGGMQDGSVLKGYQPGGPLSGILPAAEVDLPSTLDPYRERGMFLGSGGIVFFDEKTSIVDLCLFMLGFCEDESCGRCTTCHGGTQRAVEILRRISLGGGRETDLDKLEDVVATLVWSNCLHGQFAPTAIKLALKYFRDEFMSLIRDKVDPTRSLPGFIEYRVRSQSDPALPEAVAICPTNAIVEDHRGQWIVDDRLCVLCGACKEVAPDAIAVVDRFAAAAPAVAAAAAGGA